jgi:DNA-binding winged helix-turn-helix (wHTH) protein
VSTNPGNTSEIAFGPFRLDVERRLLFRAGASVPLRSRGAEILCALVAASGKLVTKEELMAQVWPRLNVGENTVHVHISALRKALGEDVGGQRFIVTIPGRGYRFVAGSAEGATRRPPLFHRSLSQPDAVVFFGVRVLRNSGL